MKIRRGDKVMVTTGKYKKQVGTVIKVLQKLDKIIVSGVNEVKKHTKPSQVSAGGIINKEMPIHISNVAHYDPELNVPSKVAIKILDNGEKVRILKKSGNPVKSV